MRILLNLHIKGPKVTVGIYYKLYNNNNHKVKLIILRRLIILMWNVKHPLDNLKIILNKLRIILITLIIYYRNQTHLYKIHLFGGNIGDTPNLFFLLLLQIWILGNTIILWFLLLLQIYHLILLYNIRIWISQN